jgi:hypothetical protein
MMKPIAIAFLLLTATTSGYGQQKPPVVQPYMEHLLSLRDLPGVAVFVQEPSPSMKKAGLRADDLRAGVEGWLRRGKINVLPERAYNLEEGAPFLYVQINDLMMPRIGGYALTLKVELFQNVKVERQAEPEIKLKAATWSSLVTMYSPPGVREHVSRNLEKIVREFVAAYWLVNGKEKPGS